MNATIAHMSHVVRKADGDVMGAGPSTQRSSASALSNGFTKPPMVGSASWPRTRRNGYTAAETADLRSRKAIR
jgi:hypothetical protein